jgi:flavin-dependent dehydrogenase
MNTGKFDVVIVGASVGGCTAARLYAQRGLRVALLERSDDFSHYKKVCTHYLQPVARDTLRKMGLAEQIEAAGGRPNELEFWTDWGWVRSRDVATIGHGYNIRRQTLDPILRQLAVETPGVSFFPGTPVRSLLHDPQGRIAGVATETPDGPREFLAPLVVAADGRNSRLADLAGIPAHVSENSRFTYFTYFRGVPLRSSVNSQYWYLHPNLCYAFQNDDDTLLLGVFLPRSELRAFKADPMGNFRAFWEQVPGGPRIADAEPISELLGMTEMPNHWRTASMPGLALVGDSALALDPIWGTGCSFAFLAADWLVEETSPALAAANRSTAAIDRGLARYRRRHRAGTRWHFAHIAHFSRGQRFSAPERLILSAAARDPKLAATVLTYLGRTIGPASLFTPGNVARAVAVNVRHALASLRPSAPGVTHPPSAVLS